LERDRVTVELAMPKPYYFLFGQIFIIAGEKDADQAMKHSPELPVVNKKTIELIRELTSAKSTAEGKLKLLSDLVIDMAHTAEPGSLRS
jgi:hypothetical protein